MKYICFILVYIITARCFLCVYIYTDVINLYYVLITGLNKSIRMLVH